MKKGIYAIVVLFLLVVIGISIQNTSRDITMFATAYDLNAIDQYKKTVEAYPTDCSLAYAGIGDVYFKYGFFTEAINNYQTALKQGLNFSNQAYAQGAGYYKVGILQRLACAYFQDTQYDKSIQSFSEAVVADSFTYKVDYFCPTDTLYAIAKVHYSPNNFEQLKRDFYKGPDSIMQTIAFLSQQKCK
jgi:tetratricopeptide (TPR) repeat protein